MPDKSDKFPYESMPWRLEHPDPDTKDKKQKICFFTCEEDAQKYIARHKINKKTMKLETAVPVTKPSTKRPKRSKGVQY